jgi:hypothetical protein
MKSILFTLIAIIILAVSALADVKIVQVTTTDPMVMMGNEMPGRVDTAQIWFSSDKISLQSAEVTSLVRHDLGLMYILMPQNSTYAEIPLTAFESMGALMEEFGGDSAKAMMESMDSMYENASFDEIYESVQDSAQAQQLYEMAQQMQGMFSGKSDKPMITVHVNPTGETKMIHEWNCTKYLVDFEMVMGMTSHQEIWASNDLQVDYKSFLKAMSGMMAGFTGYAEAMQEMEQIEGLPIYSTMSLKVMGATMNATTEVISMSEETAPTGIYDIPAGYTKVEPGQITPH